MMIGRTATGRWTQADQAAYDAYMVQKKAALTQPTQPSQPTRPKLPPYQPQTIIDKVLVSQGIMTAPVSAAKATASLPAYPSPTVKIPLPDSQQGKAKAPASPSQPFDPLFSYDPNSITAIMDSSDVIAAQRMLRRPETGHWTKEDQAAMESYMAQKRFQLETDRFVAADLFGSYEDIKKELDQNFQQNKLSQSQYTDLSNRNELVRQWRGGMLDDQEFLRAMQIQDEQGIRTFPKVNPTLANLNKVSLNDQQIIDRLTNTVTTKLSNSDFLQIIDQNASTITYYGGNQEWYPRDTQKAGGCGPTAAANMLAMIPDILKKYSFDPNNISQSDFRKFMEEVYNNVPPLEIVPVNKDYDVGIKTKVKIDQFDVTNTLNTDQFIQKLLNSVGGSNIELNVIKKKGYSTIEVSVIVPPTVGIFNLKKYASDITSFAKSKGVDVQAKTISGERTKQEYLDFIKEGLQKDCPVALFNAGMPVDLTYYNPRNINPSTLEATAEPQSYNLHWVTVTGVTEQKDTGDILLEVSTWGGKGTIDFNSLFHFNMRNLGETNNRNILQGIYLQSMK